MKKLFISMLAIAALASCAKEETLVADRGDAIGFGTPFVENSTRAAADPSFNGANKLTKFQVWGTANSVAIYEGQDVEGQVGAGSIWTCTKKNYWIEGVTYNFAAVANGTVETLSNGLPATIAYTANGTSDFIYAENKGIVGKAAGSNTPVQFTFNHLLAKAKFTVSTNTTVEGYQYEVTNIKIANAYASGVYNVGAETLWTDLVVNANGQAFDSVTVNSTNKSLECANEKLLIPVEDVVVSYTVTLKYNGDTIWSEPMTHNLTNDLVAANSYNFKITVNVGEEIKFNVDEDPSWTSTSDNNITL
ncbi:MAG: fimbrillin family protein [Alistipes sp.]|nr:fimbrillin family protein [Alistipes sp.]